MNKHILKAQKREIIGRKVKKLRKSGFTPANIYGKKIKSLAVQVPTKEFTDLYKLVGETGIIDLKVETDPDHKDAARPVLVHNLQRHAVSSDIIHIDFLQVDLKEKVSATIPVEMLGESPAEKEGKGTVVQQIQEVEVEALPGDLIDKIVVDRSILTDVDQAIFVKDLAINRSKIEVKTSPELIVVKVEPPQKEEVIAVPTPVAEAAPPEESKENAAESPTETTNKEEPKADDNPKA